MTTKKNAPGATGAQGNNVLNFRAPKSNATFCAACNAPGRNRNQGEWWPFDGIPYVVLYALCNACHSAAAEGGEKGRRVLDTVEKGLIERVPRLRQTIETARSLGGVE